LARERSEIFQADVQGAKSADTQTGQNRQLIVSKLHTFTPFSALHNLSILRASDVRESGIFPVNQNIPSHLGADI
jgi:hypothetical protein